MSSMFISRTYKNNNEIEVYVSHSYAITTDRNLVSHSIKDKKKSNIQSSLYIGDKEAAQKKQKKKYNENNL